MRRGAFGAQVLISLKATPQPARVAHGKFCQINAVSVATSRFHGTIERFRDLGVPDPPKRCGVGFEYRPLRDRSRMRRTHPEECSCERSTLTCVITPNE